MTTPAIDPIRSRILEAAAYGLSNRIIAGGASIRYTPEGDFAISSTGYYYTMHQAYRDARAASSMREYPSCNLFIEGETCNNSSNVQLEQNQSLLHNSFILRIDVFVNDKEDPQLARDRILADVQRYLGINKHIPDSAGAQTCFTCYYDSSDPWGIDKEKPNTGITIRYKVWYRQKLTDPTTGG